MEKSTNGNEKDDNTKDENSGPSKQTSASYTEKTKDISRKRNSENESSADLEENVKRSRIKGVGSNDDTSGSKSLRKYKKPYQCHICNKIYKTKASLNEHIKIVHTAKNHICDICEKKFATYGRMKTHRRGHFLHFRTHVCPTCNTSFATRKNMLRHINQIHDANENFMCAICNKTFHLKEYLMQHILSMHMNENKHICIICKKSFKWKNNLTTHYRKKHKKPYLIRNFKMDIKFHNYGSSKKSSESDRVVYEPLRYPITICGPRNLPTISEHMQDSMREKYDDEHFCKLCIKEFSSKFNLQRHMRRVHTLERPHTCQHCGKNFRLTSELKNHTKYDQSCKNSRALRSESSTSTSENIRRSTTLDDDSPHENCSNCGKSYDGNWIKWKKHKCKVKSSENKVYICSCGCKFNTEQQLNNHKSERVSAACVPADDDSDSFP